MWASIKLRLKGWKTIVANAIAGLPAALYGLYLEFQSVDFTPVIPTKYAAAVVVGMSILGIVLRLITTGPVGAKGSADPAPNTKAGD